jgi:hypothetical protein
VGVGTANKIGTDWIDYWSTPPHYPAGKDDDILNNVGPWVRERKYYECHAGDVADLVVGVSRHPALNPSAFPLADKEKALEVNVPSLITSVAVTSEASNRNGLSLLAWSSLLHPRECRVPARFPCRVACLQ